MSESPKSKETLNNCRLDTILSVQVVSYEIIHDDVGQEILILHT